jgi:cathepsin A (carboxypeptidase C)
MKRILFTLLTIFTTSTFADNTITSLPGLGELNDTQYAGYVSPYKTACKTTNCENKLGLFYWFVANKDLKDAPIILWSNGGPGSSSTFGYLFENGPYQLTNKMTLVPRENAWSHFANYLIIDHPLGVGLSFAPLNKLPKNVHVATTQYYHALQHFYAKYPQYKNNPLYLAGESYAGTSLPLLADKILQENLQSKQPINLRGLIMVSPWADPVTQQSRNADYAFTHGLVTTAQRLEVDKLYQACAKAIAKSQPTSAEANTICGEIGNYIEKVSHLSLTNIMIPELDNNETWVKYMNSPAVRKALNAKTNGIFPLWSVPLSNNYAVGMQDSYRHVYQDLLAHHIAVFILSGLDDGRDTNFLGIHSFTYLLEWPGKKRYLKAKTVPWYEPGTKNVLAYVKSGGHLHWAKVRKAGHMVPYDQPKVAKLVEEFVSAYKGNVEVTPKRIVNKP